MTEWKKKRDIMRRYDATAHMYDLRYEKEQTSKYLAALENLQKRDLGLVLDVGCGTGLLFDRIDDLSKSIVGVDISRKTSLKAKERSRNSLNIDIICADADFLPLQEGIFDHVFAFTLIQNSPKPLHTLEEVEKFSKDDAIIVFTGLKRIFSKETFSGLLREARLHVAAFEDEENLKCYVAVCTKTHH